MTRFARAKGSVASNIKVPGDSTPWEVMKEQLNQSKKGNEEASKREEAEKQRVENYNKFLKELKTQKKPATWCDFPDTEPIKKTKISPELKAKTKKLKHEMDKTDSTENCPPLQTQEGEATTISTKKRKNNKNKSKSKKPESTEVVNDISKNTDKKISKKHKLSNENSENCLDNNNASQAESSKTKKKQKKITKDAIDEKKSAMDEMSKFRSKKDNTKFKQLNGKPTRRKPINHSFELIINGKNVELVRFDGFPIMKKDAERLQELKNNMIKKGIPKSEVQRTLKLERRRAEKALARMKREVCYNCRKGGHNLSDCPDLKSNIPGKEGGEGICFKCGSTEHRQFECKVQRDQEFRFATCFICKESGHIARQCPDNPKGLYPNGGGCKLCGDVTHLRKDCPTAQDKREGSTIKLQTLDKDNLEDIDQKVTKVHEEKQRKPKKIKF